MNVPALDTETAHAVSGCHPLNSQGRIARKDHQAQRPCEGCVLPRGTGEDVRTPYSAPLRHSGGFRKR